MTPADADDVAAVEKASFDVPWTREMFWREVQNELTYYLLALDDENVVGYAGTWILSDEAQIMNFAILPSYRGKKIGRMMMARLIDDVKKRGAEKMTLEVRPSNKAAISLYTSFGFKDCGRRPHYYCDNGEDAIIMWNMKL